MCLPGNPPVSGAGSLLTILWDLMLPPLLFLTQAIIIIYCIPQYPHEGGVMSVCSWPCLQCMPDTNLSHSGIQ